MDTYTIHAVLPEAAPALHDSWDSPAWAPAETVSLEWHWPTPHPLPTVQARLLHDGRTVYGIFHVQDRSVLGTVTEYNALVCKDSCVEFFFRPLPEKGYLNLEMSASGAKLCSYITRPARRDDGTFEEYQPVPKEIGERIAVRGTQGITGWELPGPIDWEMSFQIPPAVPEAFLGPLGSLSGQRWTGNFYHCADHSATPRWMAWQGVPELNFHRPDCFGEIILEELKA
ncbi:MAG: carbohydrate-binding family 9-like protein [Oligosphaeraceae bacterium]